MALKDMRIFAEAKEKVHERADRDGIRWGLYFSDFHKRYVPIHEHESSWKTLSNSEKLVYIAEPKGIKE